MPDFRARVATMQRESREDWFRIFDKAGAAADVYIYDEIGIFGTSAKDFVDKLGAIDATQINLHLHSPGGDVFDGIAIKNALSDHPARVVAIVDGVAASSASFIAMAADEVVMNKNAELMIHDAWGLAVGNAEDMVKLADDLNRVSDNIASIYAERAGGTTEDWRALMRTETWFSAQEAVDAGLADRVSSEAPVAAKNKFDLAIFNYAGRENAPAPIQPATPETPTASAVGQPEQKEQGSMSDLMSSLRTALGITDDNADEATILAALNEALAEQTEPPVQNKVADPPKDLKKLADAAGAVIVDRGVWDEAQAKIQQGVDAARELRNQKRDALLEGAVKDGRIPPANKGYWSDLYDRDPKGTTDVVENLRRNLVPVDALGYDQGLDDNGLGEFADLFPKGA